VTENMMNSDHKTNSDSYRNHFDETFRKKEKEKNDKQTDNKK